jgi:hypothetical protein
MLFPLPLTAFENYMLADDRREFPMAFFLRLHFRGEIDRKSFEAALGQTLDRHPLFQAFVREIDGQLTWISADGARPQVIWNDSDEPAGEQVDWIDLSNEIGLRVTVSKSNDQTHVLFQFHHACTDGIGAVRFIEDLLTLYTAKHGTSVAAHGLLPINPKLLPDRGRHGLNFWKRILRLSVDSLATLGIAQFFFNRPVALTMTTQPQLADREPYSCLSSVSKRLSASELIALRDAAKREGVTINDLLIRDLLLAINGWNTEHNPAVVGSCLRVSVPVNLRRGDDATLPATNVVSMVMMDRRVGPNTNPRRLLKSIRLDTWFIKRFRLALVFTWIMEILHSVRGGFAWLLEGENPLATAVLSNLGVQFDNLPLAYLGDRAIVGDAELESIDFMPPIRRGTHAALGVVTYAGELMISLQYDANSLGSAGAENLLSLFTAQLATTAGFVSQPLVAEPIATPSMMLGEAA